MDINYKSKPLFLVAFFLFSFHCYSQNTFQGCPISGDRKIAADTLKNRWAIPAFYNPLLLSYILTLKNNSFNSTASVQIEGFIIEVKDGGLESTNCHSAKYKDTHIYVAEKANEKNKANAMVVEVTPRIRQIMKE